MPSYTIPYCDDVREFIEQEVDKVVKDNQCVVHFGSGKGDMAYRLASNVGPRGPGGGTRI